MRRNEDHIDYFLHCNNIDIAILSEIWTSIENDNNKDYSIPQSCSPRGYDGVAIAIQNSIKFASKIINNYIPIELLEVTTTNLEGN